MTIRLYRSRIEITPILRSLADAGTMLWTLVEGDGHIVFTRLIDVDPENDAIVIAFAPLPEDNRRLMATDSLMLRASRHGALLQFAGEQPSEVDHHGRLAIRLRFPSALLSHPYHHPAQPRIPPPVPLKCIADAAGVMPFDALVVDLSDVGVGRLECNAGIRLEKASVLRGTRIFHPARGELVADLEIRSTRVVPREGGLLQQAGFRLLGRPRELGRYVALFVSALDRPA